MADRSWQRLIALILLFTITACSGPQPVLRSNKQLHLYGKEQARQEIEACQRQVEGMGSQPGVHRSANVGSGAVLGLLLGGAMGASAGAWGGLVGVAIGAAAGSGLGLVVGSLGGTFKPLEPDPSYADAVTKCLKDKGYEVSGWE